MLQLVPRSTFRYSLRGIIRFVPQVPSQNAVVIAELAQHSGDVVLHDRGVAGIAEAFGTRALHPSGVVHARCRRSLGTGLGERVPAGVEQDEKRLDAVVRGDPHELSETVLEPLAILGPQLVVQEDPDGC